MKSTLKFYTILSHYSSLGGIGHLNLPVIPVESEHHLKEQQCNGIPSLTTPSTVRLKESNTKAQLVLYLITTHLCGGSEHSKSLEQAKIHADSPGLFLRGGFFIGEALICHKSLKSRFQDTKNVSSGDFGRSAEAPPGSGRAQIPTLSRCKPILPHPGPGGL